MCGRFTLTLPDYGTLARTLGVEVDPELAALYRPRYNVAPTDVHVVLRAKGGRREVVLARWGLVSSWAPDRSGAAKQINARSETAAQKPAFRDAFERRRCVVPADGFFEWAGPKGKRRPIWYHPAEGGLLRLAGLYESWRDPATGERERTFTILTTDANALVAPVHDRMPAVLLPADVDAWLGGPPGTEAEGAEAARSLLRPAPPELLVATPVSPRVNAVGNDDPGCLAPEAPPAGETLSLFGDDRGARR
jgi:putative SOS response-associated peptidase YedK